MLFLGGYRTLHRRVRNYIIDDIIPLMLVLYHLIDGAPIGQTTQIAIIDKHIYL